MKKFFFIPLTTVAFIFLFSFDANAQRHEQRGEKHGKYKKEYSRKSNDYHRGRKHKDHKHWKDDDKSHRKYVKVSHRYRKPSWASAHRYEANRHIYFREYATFYDPYREVYVYKNRGRWIQSTSVPSFMLNVNLGKARVTILGDIPVTRHPEDFYGDYNSWYWQ